MAFDLSTAVPVDEFEDLPRKGKFDITTARPVSEIEAEQAQLPRSLTPFNFPDVVSEFVGNRAAFPFQTARATPVGATLIPPRLPEDIKQIVGTAASLPVDPLTYAFGATGALPSRIARIALGTGLGAAVPFLRSQQPSPVDIGIGAVAGGVGGGLTRVLPQQGRLPQIQFEPPSRPRPLEFLRGNPTRIAKADERLDEAATKAVYRVRRRGDLHDKIFETLSREGDAAWKPMKDVAASIPGKIEVEEVRAAAQTLLQNEPERFQALNLFLDNLATPDKPYLLPKSGRLFTKTAADWSDLSSEIGMFMTRSGIRGKTARTFADMLKSDVRNAIASTLEAKAPPEMRGFITEAKNNWADYAADRDRLFQAFGPGMSPNASAKQGATLLRKAALGQLSYDEQQLMNRFKQASGIDLPESIKPIAQQLLREQRKGARGTTIRKALPYATGLGYVTSVLSGQRENR